MTAHPPLLDLPSSHVRRPLQKLEMSSLLLTSTGKKRRGYQHEFSTPCPRHFADDTPVWSKRTSKYPQAYFLILENIKLPKGRNIFHSSISNLNSYMLFVQIVSEGSANKGQALICELFSHSVMSDSLQPHGLQHPRLPCPSPSPGACSNSCLLSWWCYPTISSSVVPFSCLQSLPASGSFLVSRLFASGSQSIGASASVLPMNIQDWLPLGLTVLIFLCPRDSQESSPTSQFKSINSVALRDFYVSTLTSIHDYWKNHSFDYVDLCWQSNVFVFLIHCLSLS